MSGAAPPGGGPRIKFNLARLASSNTPSPSDQPTTPPLPLTPEEQARKGRKEVKDELEKTIYMLYEMECRAGHVRPEGTKFMEDDVPRLTESYKKLAGLAGSLEDMIPTAVIERVDEGQDPHSYTRSVAATALRDNQAMHAVNLAYISYHDILTQAIAQNFPEMKPLLKPINAAEPAVKMEEGEDVKGSEMQT